MLKYMQVKVSNRTLLFIMERVSVHYDSNMTWMILQKMRKRYQVTLIFHGFIHFTNIPDLAKILHSNYYIFKMCIYLVCRRISTGNDCKISQTQYGVTPHLHTEHKFMRHSSKQPKLFPVPMLLTSMFLVGIWYFHYHITPNGSDVAM